MERVTLYAQDISCDHCARTIKRELAQIEGVQVVDVDVPAKLITLECRGRAELERAKRVLEDIGYPATEGLGATG